MRAFAFVLNGLVQRRIELVALVAEARKTQPLKGCRQLVGHRLQRTGLQVPVAAGTVEVVEHRQQLGDNRGLGALGDELLVAQRALAVVVVLRLDALQGGLELGDLFRRRRSAASAASGAGPLGAGPAAGSRISPVSGSMRRLSVTVTGSCESFWLTCSPGHRRRQPRRPRHRPATRPAGPASAPPPGPARPGWPRRWPGRAPGSRHPASPSPT